MVVSLSLCRHLLQLLCWRVALSVISFLFNLLVNVNNNLFHILPVFCVREVVCFELFLY